MPVGKLNLTISVIFGENEPRTIKIPTLKGEPPWKSELQTAIGVVAGAAAQDLFNKIAAQDWNAAQDFDSRHGQEFKVLVDKINTSDLNRDNRLAFTRSSVAMVYENDQLPVPLTSQRLALTNAFMDELFKSGLVNEK